jgi:hypothetical protein
VGVIVWPAAATDVIVAKEASLLTSLGLMVSPAPKVSLAAILGIAD